MKIKEAIARFDTLYPNAVDYAQKREWLSVLDGRIFNEIISLYKNSPDYFTPYTAETDLNTSLLVTFPDDDIYIKFLCLQNDLLNSDIARYNNSAAVFNSAYNAFASFYNRTHTFKAVNRLKFGGGEDAVSDS